MTQLVKPGVINTTSSSSNWSRGLSPFYLGPVHLYGHYNSLNVENGWQYSKLYEEHADADGNPTPDYWKWAQTGWLDQWAHRYPMGRGRKPLCSLWDGQRMDYVTARKRIYVPLNAVAVMKSEAFDTLRRFYQEVGQVTLADYDGYDHLAKGLTLKQVADDPNKKMGHAFVLAALLEDRLEDLC